MLASVPNPGFSRSGIHNRSTKRLTRKVLCPTDRSNCVDRPWERTVHGEFPIFETIRSDSPIPKRNKPNERILSLVKLSDHGEVAVQGTVGTVLLG
jgi:hypothetical protein